MDAFDETDFRILAAMWAGPHYFRVDRLSLEALGRAVGLHRSSVAARIAKWERAGFLARVSVDVDPTTIGLVGAHVQVHARVTDFDEAVDAALGVPGVTAALLFDHEWVGFPVCAESSKALADTTEELKRLLGGDAIEVVADTSRDFPDAQPVELSSLDVRIIMALRRDGRRMPSALSEELGVSTRTVERRIERLRAEGVVYTLPIIDFSRAAGMVVGYLHFPLPAEHRDRALYEALATVPHVLVRQTEAPQVGRLLIYASTPAELGRAARDVAAVPGIGRATLRVFQTIRHATAFDSWLEGRLMAHAARGPYPK